MFREIQKCRICGNRDLVPVLSLGEQYLTGVFPNVRDATLSRGPLELVACDTADNRKACGLVQLRQSYNLEEMYGENYGYRSSLNRAMVKHLGAKVHQLIQRYPLELGDLVLDIGSNDGTLLSFYPEENLTVVGIDPTARKFASFYRKHISLIPDFFSAELFREKFGTRRARIVTSIAMFYDLENPLSFMEDVTSILEKDGIWHFEMSYLPAMVRTMGYDTVCHEHLEYYSLRQIKWMTARCGLKILNVEFNETNGGSFAVTVARQSSSHPENTAQLEQLLYAEETQGLGTVAQHRAFEGAVIRHKEKLLSLLHALKDRSALRAWLRSFDQGKRPLAALRNHARPAPSDRRSKQGQIRLLHSRHKYSDHFRAGSTCDETRLSPRSAMAFSRKHRPAGKRFPQSWRKVDLSSAGD